MPPPQATSSTRAPSGSAFSSPMFSHSPSMSKPHSLPASLLTGLVWSIQSMLVAVNQLVFKKVRRSLFTSPSP